MSSNASIIRRPRAKPISLAVRAALLGLSLAMLAPATHGQAASNSGSSGAMRSYQVAPGPLGNVLAQFAAQAGVQLSFDGTLATTPSPGIQGVYSVQEGFRRLLDNTGYALVDLKDGSYSVHRIGAVPASGAALPAVTISAAAVAEDIRGATPGIVARRSATGTKTDTAISEIPQSISVITRDQLDAQGVESLAEGLRYTPGVVQQYGNTDLRYDWLTMRGFVPGRYLDGLRLPFGTRGYAQPRIEPFGLERIEVLRGPASLLYGQGTPGGLVNMVSKRPTVETVREVEAQIGSYNRKQLGLDLGGKLDDTGELSYRLVALGRKSDTAYDYVNEEKTYLAPSLTWRPNAVTQLTLLAQYQKIDSRGGGGAPVLTANGTLYTGSYPALARSTFAGEPNFDRFSNEQYFIGYEFEHQLNDAWTVRQNLRFGEVDTNTQRVQVACVATPCNPASLPRYAWAFPEKARLFTIDNQLQGNFDLGATRHTLLAGADYSSERSHYDETSLNVFSFNFNAYNPVYGNYSGVIPPVATRIWQDRDQFGLYLQDQIRVGRWTVVAGGRYDWADTGTLTTTSTSRTQLSQHDSAFTGRLGLLYSFDNGITPYVSYSTSFQPTTGTSRTQQVFQPTKGKQAEAGVKYQPQGSRTMLTLSVYELTQQNVTTPDPLNTSFNEQTGEVRVRGLELEGKVTLQKGLDLIGSYGYTDSKITKANATGAGVNTTGNRLAFVPRNQASAWLDYTVQDAGLAGLGMGVGARYLGDNYGDNTNLFHMPGVTLFDAALRYDFGKTDARLKGLRMALNASNLLNKTYVAACLAAAGCYYGDGRNVYLTMKYGW